ncbi:pilus assembly protein TadG-related protein [bacterium]|nr:pilus assembly protein TadG-related protein [bacterium]
MRARYRTTRVCRGAALVMLLGALGALLGMAALSIDVTRMYVAAQRAQSVADASAFGAGGKLPDSTVATTTALSLAATNIAQAPAWPTVVGSEDVTYYPPGSTIFRPDGSVLTQLGGSTHGIMVKAHVQVDFAFAGVIGRATGIATRYAVVVRGAASGMQCIPMWISSGSPELGSGGPINLLKVDDPKGAVPPGSFGFLDFSVSGEDWFRQLLSGYNVSEAVARAAYVQAGGVVTALTGERTGQWEHYLEQETGQYQGQARLERAMNDPTWSQETPEPGNYSRDNPRLIQVPVVDYAGGTGSTAKFTVVGFAEMWLLDVCQGGKKIQVQFLQYNYFSGGGGDLDPRVGGSGGVFIVRPIA